MHHAFKFMDIFEAIIDSWKEKMSLDEDEEGGNGEGGDDEILKEFYVEEYNKKTIEIIQKEIFENGLLGPLEKDDDSDGDEQPNKNEKDSDEEKQEDGSGDEEDD